MAPLKRKTPHFDLYIIFKKATGKRTCRLLSCRTGTFVPYTTKSPPGDRIVAVWNYVADATRHRRRILSEQDSILRNIGQRVSLYRRYFTMFR